MKHILVCDDEPHITKLMKINLERAGYDVTLAGDGREAKEVLAKKQFDLAILDLVMPFADGIEVLQYLRCELRKLTPVVIMTQANLEDLEDRIAPYPPARVATQDGKFDWIGLLPA